MDDRLDIPIVTTADTSGADKTSAALDKLTGQTQEYQQALSKTNAAGKADVAMSGQVATATEKLGVKKKELKEILHKLGAEFPLVAEAAKTFLNPLTAAVSIAAIYIQKLARDIKQMQESLEISEWEGYGRVIAEQKKSFEQAALGAESFKRQLKSVKDAATTASEASEKLMTIHKAMLNTEEQLDAAHKDLDIARVKAGTDDPVRQAQKLLEIEDKYAARKRTRAAQEANFEISESHRKLANEEIAGHLLDSQIAKLVTRVETLKSEGAVTEQLRIEKENLAKTTEDIAKKSERLEQLNKSGGPGGIALSGAQLKEKAFLTLQIQDLEAVRGPQSQFVGRVEAARFGKLDEARAAQEELDRKRAERLGISQRVQGIRGMLPTQEALADIATRGANTIGRIEGETRGIPVAAQSVTTQQGKDILAASTTADRLAAGGSASGADRQFLQGLASFINKREMSLSEAVKYMSKANDTVENLNAEVARLNARIDALNRSTMNQIRR